jgi:hypothetical protein
VNVALDVRNRVIDQLVIELGIGATPVPALLVGAQGGITKTGNAHLRRVLVESAWHYRHHPFVSATLRARQQDAPADSVARAWTAQQRLYRRYQRFAARGKPKQHIVTAVARELAGFVWAALTQTSDRPTVERRILDASMR